MRRRVKGVVRQITGEQKNVALPPRLAQHVAQIRLGELRIVKISDRTDPHPVFLRWLHAFLPVAHPAASCGPRGKTRARRPKKALVRGLLYADT